MQSIPQTEATFVNVGAPKAQPNQQILKPATPFPGRVLIVEDEAELAEVLEYNLMRSGFDVVIAADGLEACRLIGREKPDLILLDLMLPLLDGWEICRMLRTHEDPLMARIPIIMLSAMGTAADRLKGYHLGADLYLPKPYVIKEVVLKTGQLIEKRREYLALTEKMTAFERWDNLQENWQQVLFHELKNQLMIISGMARRLSDEGSLNPASAQGYVSHIQKSSHYLETLAKNYLLVRRLEENSYQLQGESVRLCILFEELDALFTPVAQQSSSNLRFASVGDESLQLHPVGIKIILSSLIDNALKYSSAGAEVVVSAEFSAQKGEIRVSDNGPGIAPAERQKVFEKFYRSGHQQNGPAGSGLGLYMARTLAESMGARLILAETSSPGCSFRLQFPRRRAECEPS